MIKLEFKNAVVNDSGYGLWVNGEILEEIISKVLGVKVGNKTSYDLCIPEFKSNCCDISITIDPKPSTTRIENDEYVWKNIEEMEEDMREQFKEKNAEKDPKE